jgi:hypothetical protein
MSELNPVTIFSEGMKPSLIGLSGEEFATHYGDFEWLLLRSADRVPVAGVTKGHTKALLGEACLKELGLTSLDGYVYQHGPGLLRDALEVVSRTDPGIPGQQGHSARVTGERKDKGPPQVGG